MNVEIAQDTMIQALEQHVSCELEGRAVILQMDTGTYYGLDEVGSDVWRFVQQPHTLKEIVDFLLERYEVDRIRCESDLERLLYDMHRTGIVRVANSGTPCGCQA